MSQNLPYFSIYKGDFLRGNVSACSIAAQGLWFRLMILMHDSERTGYLSLNGLPIPSRIAAIKCAVSVDEYETLLAELMSVSAFSTSRENIIFSPQLVAEAEERAANAERQRKFYQKNKPNAKPNGNLTPNLTAIQQKSNSPSSSSSSSSDIKNVSKETGKPVDEDIPIQRRIWRDGVELLKLDGMKEKEARNLLGKLGKDYTESLLAEAIAVTQQKNPAEIQTFLIGVLKQRSDKKSAAILPTLEDKKREQQKHRGEFA